MGTFGSNRAISIRTCLLSMIVLVLLGFAALLFPTLTLEHSQGVANAATDAVRGSNAGIGTKNEQARQPPNYRSAATADYAGTVLNQVGVGVGLVVQTPDTRTTVPKFEDPDFKVLADRTQRCSCITRNRPPAREIRFYDVNRTDSFVHGLRHDLHNYRAMVVEAMLARRLFFPHIALPKLNVEHNFGRAITLDDWEDYVDLETSTVVIKDISTPAPTVVCEAVLADCVVGKRELQGLLQAMKRLEMKQPGQWRPQIVDMVALTPVDSDSIMLQRHPGKAAIYNNMAYADAIREKFTSNVTLARSLRTRRTAKAILRAMKRRRDTIVVAHVRRGDKLSGGAAVRGLDESTSAPNILRVLHLVAPPSTTVMYIMTNEWNSYHFDPVRTEYDVTLWFDFRELRDLLSGCQIPFYPWAADKACESLLAYQIEEEMMELVHPSRRVVTFASDGNYQWRHFNRAPYLHPAGEFMPPTTRQWCKTVGQPCKFAVHCCSLRCEAAAVGKMCEEWQPPPRKRRLLYP